MQRISIVAPALSDADAIDLIRDLARDGYSIDAKGPLYGEGMEFADSYEHSAVNPDEMPPQDRKAYYESELSRLQFEAQSGRLQDLPEQHPAPTGWYITAMRGEA